MGVFVNLMNGGVSVQEAEKEPYRLTIHLVSRMCYHPCRCSNGLANGESLEIDGSYTRLFLCTSRCVPEPSGNGRIRNWFAVRPILYCCRFSGLRDFREEVELMYGSGVYWPSLEFMDP